MAIRPPLAMQKVPGPVRADNAAAREPTQVQTGKGHKEGARAKTPRASTRVGKRAAVAWLEPEAVKQLGIMAIQEETTVQDLLAEAVDLLFAKRGKPRLAVRVVA